MDDETIIESGENAPDPGLTFKSVAIVALAAIPLLILTKALWYI